ncbi:MAG TPA: metallophosphoesterase [Patescibacteria group bacterium]|nr:metallophosphoesterase [Patescibacteria group bacterium]
MKLTRRKFILSGIWATLSAVFADAFWFEKFFIETNEYFFKGTDSIKDPIKILQVSDLHLQYLGYTEKNLAKKINILKPDLICFTGDSIDKREHSIVLDEFLKLIDHKILKAAILGNWEYWGNVEIPLLKEIYARHNCELLINESQRFIIQGRSISITGIDDFIGGNSDFSKAVSTLQKSDLHIVLTHCPQHFNLICESSPKLPIDLVLSGHTHGGQITLLGIAPIKPPGSGRFLKGWYHENDVPLYVSKGVGTSILPIRFGARAEIALFHI